MTLTDNNKAFALIAGNRVLPEDWGFPLTDYSGGCGLRETLMFLQDQEGSAQLCRWYYSFLRALPAAWREVSGGEGYRPSFSFKPAVWSPSIEFSRDPNTGRQALGWIPGPETRALSGTLLLDSAPTLDLGGKQYPLVVVQHADSGVFSVTWPEFLLCEAGLVEAVGTHSVAFRPRSFALQPLIDLVLDRHEQDLQNTGLLGTFTAFPRPEQKIAVAWLAVHRLERDV